MNWGSSENVILVSMIFSSLLFRIKILVAERMSWQRILSSCLLTLMAAFSLLLLLGTPPALAAINDDRFDGNIFALYGGNGSLVPPRVDLAESLKRGKPAFLVYYIDDSSDCKQFAAVVSQLQAFYGRAANFIPVDVDAIPQKSTYPITEPGYYYQGFVPQTVLINQKGEAVFNETGKVSFEKVDDAFREVFNLLPRSESVELKQRPVNEFNTELSR